MYPDLDPALLIGDLQYANNIIKKSQNSKKKDFFTVFCLMMEGSGSVPLTNGSRSGRPKTFGSGTLVGWRYR
jgi:hypothetical protein